MGTAPTPASPLAGRGAISLADSHTGWRPVNNPCDFRASRKAVCSFRRRAHRTNPHPYHRQLGGRITVVETLENSPGHAADSAFAMVALSTIAAVGGPGCWRSG